MNTYGYVNQNPLRYIDPFGLEATTNDQRFFRRPITALDILGFGFSLVPKLILMCTDDGEDSTDDLQKDKIIDGDTSHNEVQDEYDSLEACVGCVNPLIILES